jgi:hypothetical protein
MSAKGVGWHKGEHPRKRRRSPEDDEDFGLSKLVGLACDRWLDERNFPPKVIEVEVTHVEKSPKIAPGAVTLEFEEPTLETYRGEHARFLKQAYRDLASSEFEHLIEFIASAATAKLWKE